MTRRRKRRIFLAFAAAVYAVGTVVARSLGYRIGPNTVVRCRRGHLFTTIWIPGVSVKSVRLGWWRIQRCPVGPHWSIVVPVRDASLSKKDLRRAHDTLDARIP
ncbi:MAG TPA: hypothetical protein VMJ49_12540 [Gaiellaceae bacterium]|nr:hypothetical protein [Gaiellaceae bacterium]